MAATYGRLTGKTSVSLSTLGLGATNLITASAYASGRHADGEPLRSAIDILSFGTARSRSLARPICIAPRTRCTVLSRLGKKGLSIF